MPASRVFSLLVAICLAFALAGAALAAPRITSRPVTPQQAQREASRRLKKMGVRGEVVREVELAIGRAAAAGALTRRSQSFVGTSFGGQWTNKGRTSRAVVTFTGDQVHVDMASSNGRTRQVTSKPMSAMVPLEFQGTRVEHWMARPSGSAVGTLRVIGTDGEILDHHEATSANLRAWTH